MRQTSILEQILEPGLYACTQPWTNEMGHRWKVDDLVVLIRHQSADSCWVMSPKVYPNGQGFCLRPERMRESFARCGGLPPTGRPIKGVRP